MANERGTGDRRTTTGRTDPATPADNTTTGRTDSTAVSPPALPAPYVGPDTIPGLVRRLRRLTNLSQRELAEAAKVAPTTVARVESGELMPSLRMLMRLLAVGRLLLVVTDEQGRVIAPMRTWDETRDGGERRFPAHLDLILDPRAGEWWADTYGLARPPETFHRDRQRRDARRRRSQWEVRVQQFRGAPEPPDPDRQRRWPG
jgi:transcriptional regulator with XRE-family HTH domain